MKRYFGCLTLLLAVWVPSPVGRAQQVFTRLPTEQVDSSKVRQRQHLTPNSSLLFNGLGLAPAGQHVPISDLPLKMVVAPDRKAVVAVCAGFQRVGVNVVSLDAQHETQFIPLAETFNGLAFSPDGKRFYVCGGSSGSLYVFKYAGGKAELEKTVRPDPDAALVFLAGLAVNPATGTLYVCNEANHEIWVVRPETLQARANHRRRATPPFVRPGSGWPPSLRQQLGQPQRQRYRHQDPTPVARYSRGHPPQRHGIGSRRPALRGLRRR